MGLQDAFSIAWLVPESHHASSALLRDLLDAPIVLAACCEFDLCHKYILNLCIYTMIDGWSRASRGGVGGSIARVCACWDAPAVGVHRVQSNHIKSGPRCCANLNRGLHSQIERARHLSAAPRAQLARSLPQSHQSINQSIPQPPSRPRAAVRRRQQPVRSPANGVPRAVERHVP